MSGIDWSKAPDWATAVMRNEGGRLFYVEEFGRDGCRAVAIYEPCDQTTPRFGGDARWGLLDQRPLSTITLTAAEVSSGYDRVQWAEDLIRQMPVDHEGRNSWLMNYGDPVRRAAVERTKACDEMFGVLLSLPEDRKLNRSDIVEALYDAGYHKP